MKKLKQYNFQKKTKKITLVTQVRQIFLETRTQKQKTKKTHKL